MICRANQTSEHSHATDQADASRSHLLHLVQQQRLETRQLRAENASLRQALLTAESRLTKNTRQADVVRRQHLCLKSLSTALNQATQEVTELKRSLRLQSQPAEKRLQPVNLEHFYAEHPPQRVWRDACPEVSTALQQVLASFKALCN